MATDPPDPRTTHPTQPTQTATPTGLRERKKRETRFALSQAAIRLTLERGWDNVTVEDIATAANVSERTFRNYFTSKAEAIVATHVERGQRIAEALHDRPSDEPLWTALVNAVVTQFTPAPPPAETGTDTAHPAAHPTNYPAALQLLLAEPAVQYEVFRAHATAQDDLTTAIADRTGTSPTDLYPQLVAAVVSAALGTALTRWTQDPTGSIAPLLHEVFTQIRTGLPDPR